MNHFIATNTTMLLAGFPAGFGFEFCIGYVFPKNEVIKNALRVLGLTLLGTMIGVSLQNVAEVFNDTKELLTPANFLNNPFVIFALSTLAGSLCKMSCDDQKELT